MEEELENIDAINQALEEARAEQDMVDRHENAPDLTEENNLVVSAAVAVAPQAQTQSVAEFNQMVLDVEAKRNIVMAYIKRNMVDGVDYGVAYDGSKKKVLLKPGAEKLHELLKCREVIIPDHETMDIFNLSGSPVVAFKCQAVNGSTGEVMATGRGACFLATERNGWQAEKKWSPNMLIKMAQKRASVDCAIRLAGISSEFTQDMEQEEEPQKPALDPARKLEEAANRYPNMAKNYRQQPALAPNPPAPTPSRPPAAAVSEGSASLSPFRVQSTYPITKPQLSAVWAIACAEAKTSNLLNPNTDGDALNNFLHWMFGVKSTKQINYAQAKYFINRFTNGQDTAGFLQYYCDYKNSCK